MHIILGLLGTVVTILILLNRLAEAGIDLGGLNPFLWRRRRKWQKMMEGNPVYHIDSPMEAAALLTVATSKADGDMSAEEKKEILLFFQSEFHLTRRDAAGLFVASAYLYGNGEEVGANLEKILKTSLENFSEDQAQSTLALLYKVCEIDPSGNDLKREFAGQVRRIFDNQFKPKGKWQ